MIEFNPKISFDSSKFIGHIVVSTTTLRPKTNDKEITQIEAKIIADIYDNLCYYREVLSEIKIILKFISVDRRRLNSFLNSEIDEETYYKYQLDNLIIRWVTITDLCAVIGKIVYQLDIKENQCTWPVFSRRVASCKNISIETIKKVSHLLDDIKKDRNKKVHYGINDNNHFDSVLFWNDLEKYLPVDKTAKWNSETDNKIHLLTKQLNNDTISIIQAVTNAFDSMLPQLFELLPSIRFRSGTAK